MTLQNGKYFIFTMFTQKLFSLTFVHTQTQKFLHFSYFVSTFFSISKSTHFGASSTDSEVNATISCTFYCFAEFLHKIEHFDIHVLFSNSFDVRFPPITTSNMHPFRKIGFYTFFFEEYPKSTKYDWIQFNLPTHPAEISFGLYVQPSSQTQNASVPSIWHLLCLPQFTSKQGSEKEDRKVRKFLDPNKCK